MQAILDNVAAILGFGFLGLSFLFVYLAYSNVKAIVDQPDPNESAVSLSRFFMKTALVFMVCAGPLQWVTVALDHYFTNREVKLTVTMTHPSWDTAQGNVLLMKNGEPHKLINNPYRGSYRQDEEIQLNAEEIAAAIRKIRTQLTAMSSNITTYATVQPLTTPIDPPEFISPLDGG